MNVDVFMLLSFAMIIGELFLDIQVFFNPGFKFAGMFYLFILSYASSSIDESIRSSTSSNLRSITSILHPHFDLTKSVQDCKSFPIPFFSYCGNVLNKML